MAPLAVSGPRSARHTAATAPNSSDTRAAAGAPNIFFYNLDDLRDAFPGAIDPLRFMPKTRAWMADGRRYTRMFVADPSCCPSRASLMTGRYPHNNGVLDQADGPLFDGPHSMACYLRAAGYTTSIAGKFLTTWPKTSLPPCFDRSTIMWGGYRDVAVRVEGAARTSTGYSTTYLGDRGREYINAALATPGPALPPFLLYETPQAPHWVAITNPDNSVSRLAVPDTPYASAAVGTCSGVPEADRSDKPAYVRTMNHTTAQGQAMCQSQMRAIMSADDEFDKTMQLLKTKGVLDNTLVILSSDNGYMWGEHGRWEKFVPYELDSGAPSGAVAGPHRCGNRHDPHRLLLGPASHHAPGCRLHPAGLGTPARWGVPAAGEPPHHDVQRVLRRRRQPQHPLLADGADRVGQVRADLQRARRRDLPRVLQPHDRPSENINLLGDTSTANDPPATTITTMTNRLNAFATCSGTAACNRRNVRTPQGRRTTATGWLPRSLRRPNRRDHGAGLGESTAP